MKIISSERALALSAKKNNWIENIIYFNFIYTQYTQNLGTKSFKSVTSDLWLIWNDSSNRVKTKLVNESVDVNEGGGCNKRFEAL